MTSPRRRLSRRELAFVAAALLVPLPLFAATGFSAPLPNAIDRALGGLVVIDAHDQQTGSSATVAGSEEGNGTKRSADGSVAFTRHRHGRAGRTRPTLSGLIGSPTDQNDAGGGAGTQQQESSPDQNGGDTGSPEQPAPGDPREPADPGEPGPDDDSTAADKPSDRSTPSAQIGVEGQGTGVAVSVDPGGVRVGGGAAGDGAGSDDDGDAGLTVSRSDGSSSGVNVTVPGIGAPTR